MNETFDLAGKVIAVTGASGALAGTAARYLAKQGARVAFISRTKSKLETAIEGLDSEATAFPCDVTDRAALENALQAILEKYNRLDGLVNGAGGNMPGATITPDKTIFDLDLNDYDQVLRLNLHGTLLPSLIFGQHFSKQGHGSIVNFSSASSTQALTRVLGYSNAKAAVDNLTRWMATDFAKKYGDTIRVNAVCPGFFVGDQNRALLLKEDGTLTERGQQIIDQTPMGRFGEAEEVCGAIHFLLSNAARFVTGQVLHIDGGFGIYSGV
ncbi:MAG: putative oxidoreductase UxuB [Opitutia bacterium UBA7350]|nr:MAG: putative oxidoreductase UxuB [Opitutae bacterium UBA7350]